MGHGAWGMGLGLGVCGFPGFRHLSLEDHVPLGVQTNPILPTHVPVELRKQDLPHEERGAPWVVVREGDHSLATPHSLALTSYHSLATPH